MAGYNCENPGVLKVLKETSGPKKIGLVLYVVKTV